MLMEARLEKTLSEIQKLEDIDKDLEISSPELEIETFRKRLKEEKPKSLEQVVLMVNVKRTIQSLKHASNHFQFQVAATKPAFKIHQKNE